MKYTIILFFIFLYPFYSVSQNFFQIELGTDSTYIEFKKAIETDDHSYILGGAKYLYTDSIGGAYLTKLSETGEIIIEKEISIKDSLLMINDLFKTGDNKFMTLTYIWKDTSVYSVRDIIFTEYDYDLNEINEFRIKFPTDTLFIQTEMDVRKNGNELLCFGKCRSIDNYTAYYYMYKMTSEGDSIDFQQLYGKIYDLEITNDGHIFMTGMGFEDLYMTISKLNYNDLSCDSTFDTADIPDIPNMGILLDEKTYLEFITDSTFIFAGIDLQVQMNITVLDTSFNVLHNTSFGFDYQEFSAKREGLSVLNENEIFIANWDIFTGYGLAKLDSELNILWEKFYTIENEYGFNSILATEDSGCLLLGIKLNNNRMHAVIIKTDNNGNISGTDEEPANVTAHELILYPNPGNEHLNIRTAVQRIGGEFTMYDISGKLVLQQKITQSITEINTQDMPSGVYIYSYIHEDKEIESGKWVKQ